MKKDKDIASEIADAFVARSVPGMTKTKLAGQARPQDAMRMLLHRAHLLLSSALGILMSALANIEKDKPLTPEDRARLLELRDMLDEHLGKTINLWLAMNRHLIHIHAEDEDGMISRFNSLMKNSMDKTVQDIREQVLPSKDEIVGVDKTWYDGLVEYFQRVYSMLSMRKPEAEDGR